MASNLHQAQSHDILRSWQSQRNDINHRTDFVLPMFIGNNDDAIEVIESMPETFRYGCNSAIDYLAPLIDQNGLRAVLLFPVISKTDRTKLDAEEKGYTDSRMTTLPDSSTSPSTTSDEDRDDDDDDDDDDGDGDDPAMAERLLNEDQTEASNNPFLSQENEDEHLLLAGDQMETSKMVSSLVSPVARLAPPSHASEKVADSHQQKYLHDIRLINGLALKDKYNPVLRLIPKLRARFPNLLIICDVCLCAFTSTGHCCLFENHGRVKRKGAGSKSLGQLSISNRNTCNYLAILAAEYAMRGCDVVAPSDMMDGRILAIREHLNENDLNHVSIMSYSAKFASAYYGPFRQATGNAPKFGDRRAYQLPPGSRALASKAVRRDINQGADFVMVKPGGLYLDIVRDIREQHPDVPIAVYQVSGEYSMLKLASKAGLIDLKLAVAETLTAFRRAGASIIISYFTPEILRGELLTDDLKG